jgi:hypothetical protein
MAAKTNKQILNSNAANEFTMYITGNTHLESGIPQLSLQTCEIRSSTVLKKAPSATVPQLSVREVNFA